MSDLQTAIRRARFDRGLTQKELADRAGVKASYVSMIERGDRTNLSSEVLQAILQALHLKLVAVRDEEQTITVTLSPATLMALDRFVEGGLHGSGREGVAEAFLLAGLREAIRHSV